MLAERFAAMAEEGKELAIVEMLGGTAEVRGLLAMHAVLNALRHQNQHS